MNTYEYSQEQINSLVNYLDKLTITGINNVTLLSAVINIINNPVTVNKEREMKEEK